MLDYKQEKTKNISTPPTTGLHTQHASVISDQPTRVTSKDLQKLPGFHLYVCNRTGYPFSQKLSFLLCDFQE